MNIFVIKHSISNILKSRKLRVADLKHSGRTGDEKRVYFSRSESRNREEASVVVSSASCGK